MKRIVLTLLCLLVFAAVAVAESTISVSLMGLYAGSNCSAHREAGDGYVAANVSQTTGDAWDVTMSITNIPVKKGVSYQVEFAVSGSDSESQISAVLADAADWSIIGSDFPIKLSTTKKSTTVVLKSTKTCSAAAIVFWVGGKTGKYTFYDNIIITEVNDTLDFKGFVADTSDASISRADKGGLAVDVIRAENVWDVRLEKGIQVESNQLYEITLNVWSDRIQSLTCEILKSDWSPVDLAKSYCLKGEANGMPSVARFILYSGVSDQNAKISFEFGGKAGRYIIYGYSVKKYYGEVKYDMPTAIRCLQESAGIRTP